MPTAADTPPGEAPPLAHDGAHPHPLVASLLPHLVERPAALRLEIAAGDEMLAAVAESLGGGHSLALAEYFLTGRSVARVWRLLLERAFPGRQGLRLLDFGSGWGRVTRFLLAERPDCEITVADAMAPAAAFQQQRFGTALLPLPERPAPGAVGQRYDAVLATSVFTHLPEAGFHAWLAWLLERVAPGGLLAFTANHPEALPGAGAEDARVDYAFGPDSENRSLDGERYGTSWVREGYVRAAVSRCGPDFVTLAFPRQVRNFQDLYVVLAPPVCPERLAELPGEPWLMLEACELSAGGLAASGWVATAPESPEPAAVEAWVGDVQGATGRLGAARPELGEQLGRPQLRGWSWFLEVPLGRGEDLDAPLVLIVADAAGERFPLFAGPPAGWVRQPLLLAHADERRRARFFAGRYREVAAALETTGWERHRLERRLAAVEQSRFWRARKLWFRLKRALGLPAVE